MGLLCTCVACGGDDFTADGPATGGSAGSGGSAAAAADAGSDASRGGQGGAAANGGQAGAGGQADSGPAACDLPLAATNCNELTTGDPGCDDCGRNNCCPQANTCLADVECRRLLACFLASCKDQEPVSCGASKCSECLKSVLVFTGLSQCLQTHCNDQCPFKVP